MRLRFLWMLLLAMASCTQPPVAPHAASLSWVWILTGPKDATLSGEAREQAFAGHFANMDRLAKEGELLIAGPFGEPRTQPDHRGIFLLNTAELDQAQRLADSDPTAEAGVFRFEIEPFVTAAPLALVGPRHEAAVAAAGVASPPPGFHCRPYVLASGPAMASGRAPASALFWGTLGSGDQARTLLCLDAQTLAEAQAMLPQDGVDWTLMPWFASEEIANLKSASDSQQR